ncbi:lipoyl(octanoyl) transferase LipB [Thiolapillus brandeum]|uniref:Octanoyltransferase n=1 Tax=Thiolapillus brandeum TaxID=1076588 RepID=A0A7U6GGI2_9GAMM|nr:lipoyl(octanoyl) transferase LipB [Thiolapillus brandeum]BAO43201.1 lipoyl(octanoyl) transferase [Thiolapillus brandeum]
MPVPVIIRNLGQQDYLQTWQAMQRFTNNRKPDIPSEIWLLEHPPVFTQGQAGKAEHLLDPGTIPVVQSDRGGQITYHGPGQLIAYLLLDLKSVDRGIRGLVTDMEQSVIGLLAEHGIPAASRPDAPGVYVDKSKIAALGLRVRRGYTYHGLALNLDMDLEPFARINPCGYPGQAVTRLKDLGVDLDMDQAGRELVAQLCRRLNLQPRWQT